MVPIRLFIITLYVICSWSLSFQKKILILSLCCLKGSLSLGTGLRQN
uniref:Uncharacterized protein n=1 Tax=Anguilla anguilla TaxID=7936 RepID=A0A0E9R7V3_ANGAN